MDALFNFNRPELEGTFDVLQSATSYLYGNAINHYLYYRAKQSSVTKANLKLAAQLKIYVFRVYAKRINFGLLEI